MKRIITLIAAAVMMTVATNSFAQLSVGAGYLHAGDQITLQGISDPFEVGMNGAYAGFSYNLPISDLIGIAPGLYYSLLMCDDSFEDIPGTDIKIREHFVNVPVYFNLGFNVGANSRLFLFAGPTVQLGVASKTTYPALSTTHDNYKDNDYSRTNVLLGGGLGLNLGRFQITAGYDHGMFNLDKSGDGTKRIKRYAKAGVAYRF